MTEEELEKKAEEYSVGKAHEHYNYLFEEHAGSPVDFARWCFKDGAEFGYNKANEWHFVKDGDLPKENQLVLLYRENPNGANVALTYWYKSYVNDKVIAWKEIVPPKEPKDCRKCKHLSKGNRGVCISDCTCENYDKYEGVE